MSIQRLRLALTLISLTALTFAQTRLQSGAAAAAVGPAYGIGVGYDYVGMSLPAGPRSNLNGIVVSGNVDLSQHWGATMESSYARATRLAGSDHSNYSLSVMTGPVFTPLERTDTRLLVRVLAGASLVDGAVPAGQLYYRGWEERFSYAAGAGVERRIFERWAFRINGDYLRTEFVNQNGVLKPQNSIRLAGSLVIRVGNRHEASSVIRRHH